MGIQTINTINNVGVVVCKKCGLSKKINISNIKHYQNIQVTCRCKNIFIIKFNKRQYYRKEVSLPIKFRRIYPDTIEGTGIINNISFTGLNFTLTFVKELKQKDVLKIEFTLDDLRKQIVRIKGEVIRVDNRNISIKFLTPNEQNKKIIGFYMMP